jgi:hypothetical protein
MRASIDGDLLVLHPENEPDKEAARTFALKCARPRMISHRGFSYMQPAVEFIVQDMPRND